MGFFENLLDLPQSFVYEQLFPFLDLASTVKTKTFNRHFCFDFEAPKREWQRVMKLVQLELLKRCMYKEDYDRVIMPKGHEKRREWFCRKICVHFHSEVYQLYPIERLIDMRSKYLELFFKGIKRPYWERDLCLKSYNNYYPYKKGLVVTMEYTYSPEDTDLEELSVDQAPPNYAYKMFKVTTDLTLSEEDVVDYIHHIYEGVDEEGNKIHHKLRLYYNEVTDLITGEVFQIYCQIASIVMEFDAGRVISYDYVWF